MIGNPDINLAGEMGFAATDYALVAVIILIALAYLTRGFWRRKGATSVCDSCPGCGSGQPCSLPKFEVPSPETKANEVERRRAETDSA